MNGQDIILYILDEGKRAIPEQIAKRLIESFPGGRDWINPDSVAIIADVLRVYAAAQADAVTRAISADRCPECRGGDEPTYDEHWRAWYHDRLLCLGSTARLAAAQP